MPTATGSKAAAAIDTSSPEAWARTAGVPMEAVELYRTSDVIDLHIDTFIWTRILRYDMTRAHGPGPLGRRYFWHVDIPRAIDGGVTGGCWSITTNPLRSPAARGRAFERNLRRLRSTLETTPGVRFCRTVADYRAARAAGEHGAFIAVQGGNAVVAPGVLERVPRTDGVSDLVRVTLVHLTASEIGATSAPAPRLPGDANVRRGLSEIGKDLVGRLTDARILVDLAHIAAPAFWDAMEVTSPDTPVVATHTGVDGVRPHWRNLDDDQIRAIAERGGVVGIMLQEGFLVPKGARKSSVGVATVVDHLEHVVRIGGEATAAIGTDLDGMVTPPGDLCSYRAFPRLVAEMQRRGWRDERIRGILGTNALRVIEAVRG